MTRQEAQTAIDTCTKVQAGSGEDHDTGYIFRFDGDMAYVSWDSGVCTHCPLADLTAA